MIYLNINIIMATKNLRYNKKIKDETEAFQKLINSYTSKLKKEYEKEVLNAQITLLEQIAEGENLNIIELKDKYLQATKTKKEKKETTKGSINSESLLEKITYKSKTYYYENKEGGNVYNEESVIVGSFNNGEIKLNSKKSNNA